MVLTGLTRGACVLPQGRPAAQQGERSEAPVFDDHRGETLLRCLTLVVAPIVAAIRSRCYCDSVPNVGSLIS